MGESVHTEAKWCRHCGERTHVDARKCPYCEWFRTTAPDAVGDAPSPAPVHHEAEGRPAEKTSVRAIAAFVFALLGGVLGAILAVVLGWLARQEIRNSEGRIKGGGLARAGLVIGLAQLEAVGLVAMVTWLSRRT